jgi:pimeloyl-ACP methyl ester carboxylesterase
VRTMKRTASVFLAILVFSLPCLAQAPSASGFFTASDGVKIHYLTAGNTGSWVVLIHGYMDSAQRMWFTTGIAPALAKNHRVVALDNRNHGESDKPQPNGTGRALDVIELMDHLKIQKAHIHGYSMGGGMTGQLLAIAPQRFITAGFGGSGLTETDPELRSKAAAMDEKLPKAEGRDAEAMDRFRTRVASARPATAATPATVPTTPPTPTTPAVDLTKLSIPIIAINGAFDSPYSKTHRLWREAGTFQNVILPGKTHLTAIAVGGPMPQQYIDATVKFIDSYDER